MPSVATEMSLALRLAALLPARNAEDWLRRSVAVWKEAFESGFVSAIVAGGECVGYLWSADESPHRICIRHPGDIQWSVELARYALRDRDISLEHHFVFPCEEESLGGLLCDQSPQEVAAAGEMAGRILKQFRLFGRPTAGFAVLSPNEAKLEAMAEFTAGAGHEINNPLATISGRVQLMLRKESDPAKRKSLETIGGQALRIRDMIGDAMLFARPPRPNPEMIDLADWCSSWLELWEPIADARGLELILLSDAAVPSFADATQIEIAMTELVRNAIGASKTGDQIVVHAESDGDWSQISITDCGVGFSPEQREHAFDPFYSGRQAGRGLGFGLCKAWRIARNHGGSLEIATDDVTTRTVLRLPGLAVATIE